MSEVRHATTAELLEVRDGEGSAWARAHVDECGACAGELYGLEQMRARLRALPTLVPPRERWTRIEPLVRRERRQRFARGAAGLATAAALTALTFVALRPAPETPSAAERAALGRAMVRSQALEQALRAVEPERRALPGEAAVVVAELEERLRRIDAALAEPGAWRDGSSGALDLWRQRAGVLGALVDVHTTRVATTGM